jgi:hypothetical protein
VRNPSYDRFWSGPRTSRQIYHWCLIFSPSFTRPQT